MEIFLYILALLMCSKYFKIFKTNPIVLGVREINKEYSKLYNEENLIIRITQGILVIISEIACLISIYFVFEKYIRNYVKIYVEYSVECAFLFILYILFHYLMGYLLLISSNLHKYMCRDEEESIKGKFLLSYFLSSIYLVLLLLIPEKLSEYVLSGFLSMGISYLINLNLLFKLMKNPKYVKINKYDRSSFGRVLTAGIIIIFMLIINLFLLVCLVDMLGPNSFSNNPSQFDLFYYTALSFTTVGFGDIIPLSVPAKFISILISFTSIFCISIFLGAIYSNRNK